MRRPVIAGLLGLAVATFAGAVAASAAGAPTLTVTPGHGPSTAPFTIAYQDPVRPCANSVTFTFDGAVLGDAPVTRKGSSCVASLQAKPVPSSGPGPHTVRAGDASVIYTVDPAPSPAPRSPLQASPAPSPTRPSGSPSDASATPSAAGGGSGSPSAEAPGGMAGRSTSEGTSATTWVLGGGALLIAVVAILALLSLRGRHGERADRERALPER
jgi:hypothetical protein